MTLTGEQLQAIKQLVNECKGISNHLRQYLIDNDLYDLEDISVGISVVPRYAFAVEAIVIGRTDSKTTGFCMTVKGDVNDEWRFVVCVICTRSRKINILLVMRDFSSIRSYKCISVEF